MLHFSALRQVCVTVLLLLGLAAPLAHAAENASPSPRMMLEKLAQSMEVRHDGLDVIKIDPDSFQITLQRGEGDKAQKLFLYVNQDQDKLADNDFFDHLEYKGYEFTLRGNNNIAVLGGVDGVIDQLETVTKYFKDNNLPPEKLKEGRVSMLFAGELVFKFQLDQEGAAPQFYINGTLFRSAPATWMTEAESTGKCNDFHKAAEDLQKKIDTDTALSTGVKRALIHLIAVSHETDPKVMEKVESTDQLTDTFARLVLMDQYFERALGAGVARYKSELVTYRAACKAVSAYKARFTLTADDKSELTEFQNAWGNKLWMYHIGSSGETHLIIRHHESKQFKLYMHRIFSKADPKDFDKLLTRADYDRVSLSFPFYGTLAAYDLKAKKFECDEARWKNAAQAFFPPSMKKIFLPPEKMFPPHVPIYRYDGQVEGMVVPKGPIFPPDFTAIPEAKRAAAHEAFLQELADKLDNAGYLHLLFQNLTQYVFDSPDPKLPAVIGNSVQKSDMHQTTGQTLDSRLAGRFIGDCDDIAELYSKITQLQGKQSYVMGVPGHAACGYVTKLDDGKFQLNFLDTGPARELVRTDLDKLIEEGVRSYDNENRMHFSPDQVEFLFRFAGEKTRTAYVLSTRMFLDPKYAEDMIRVQSYWHFHTYNLGITTMEKMLEGGDKISANYFEVSSLYSQSRLWENAFKRQREGIASIKKEDTLTNLSARLRLASWQHEAKMDEDAVQTLTELNKSLEEVPQQDLQRVLEFIQEAGMIWCQIKQPYQGYQPMRRIMKLTRGRLFFPLAPGLVNIYDSMLEYNKTHEVTDEEKGLLKEVETILNRFYSRNETMFESAEDIDDELRRYSTLSSFYRARMGEKAFREKLLEAPAVPPKGVKPSTLRRPGDPDSDFQYFRSCFYVYLGEMGKALDDEDDTKTPDIKEALKWGAEAIKAFDRQEEFTESSTGDLGVKELKANIALLTQDWATLTKLYDDAKAQDYARHTLTLSDSLGRFAKFISLDDFKKAIALWDSHLGTKQYYYLIAYQALESKSWDACAAAADVAAKRFPKDETMFNEAAALRKAIPVAKKWYEDRAVAIKKAAEAAKLKAAEDAKKKAEEQKQKEEDQKKQDAEKKPEAAPQDALVPVP